MPFASGKSAVAICDRCGLKVPYLSLKNQIINQQITGLKVCEVCYDLDHPQLQVGKYFRPEAMALKDPRPDTAAEASRELTGWTDYAKELLNQ